MKPYKWKLKDTVFSKDKGSVFSCFACGGGSTMGYKLSGFEVIGANEIDQRMADMYKVNHKPKYMFVEPIQVFSKRKKYPDELYDLDILDGSPPCSSFSMAGARESQWGKKKVFREGQASQVLDTLFFDFIALAKKLQPKVVIAENVTGLLAGKANLYVARIIKEFNSAGYVVNYTVINAQDLGIPQSRKRVFFYAVRKDLHYPTDRLHAEKPLLVFGSNKKLPVTFDNFYIPGCDTKPLVCRKKMYAWWKKRKKKDTTFGTITFRLFGKATGFGRSLIHGNKVVPCITATGPGILYDEYRQLNVQEACCAGSFPQDYSFGNNSYIYTIGMSVPPMMAKYLADLVYDQILSKQWMSRAQFRKFNIKLRKNHGY
jgi:DNA (cytosine-5)-methyltransferase 1